MRLPYVLCLPTNSYLPQRGGNKLPPQTGVMYKKPRKKTLYIEDAEQCTFVAWLNLKIQMGRLKHLKYFEFNSIPNMRMNNEIQRILAKRRGYRAGMPDMQFFWVGEDDIEHFAFMEWKRPKLKLLDGTAKSQGKLSPNQEEFSDKCERAGRKYGVAYKVEDGQRYLNLWGILKD